MIEAVGLEAAQQLTAMHAALVPESPFDFTARIGANDDDEHAVTLVARRAGRIVGYLSWGRYVDGLTGARPSYQAAPWGKLHALGVAAHEQGAGVADALLAAAVQRLPGDIIGVFGNVSLDRGRAISWYRRRGFRVGVRAELTDAAGEIAVLVVPGDLLATGVGREVHFAAPVADLVFAPRGWTVEDELARAEAVIDRIRQTTVRFPEASARLDGRVGQLLERSSRCEHNALCGPQASVLLASDPELVIACADWCFDGRQAAANAAGEDDSQCDGCRAEVDALAPFVARRAHVLVLLWLCRACAGLAPAALSRTSSSAAAEREPHREQRPDDRDGPDPGGDGGVGAEGGPARRRWWRRRS